MDKVNSLEEAKAHFLNHEGQVPPVICVKGDTEKEVTSLAEAEAFFAAPSPEATAGEQGGDGGHDEEEASAGHEAE